MQFFQQAGALHGVHEVLHLVYQQGVLGQGDFQRFKRKSFSRPQRFVLVSISRQGTKRVIGHDDINFAGKKEIDTRIRGVDGIKFGLGIIWVTKSWLVESFVAAMVTSGELSPSASLISAYRSCGLKVPLPDTKQRNIQTVRILVNTKNKVLEFPPLSAP